MNPGKLNKKIKVMKFMEITDGAGGYIDNWKTGEGWEEVTSTWSNIEPLRGRDFYQAQQSQVEISHKVIIRHRSDITHAHVINFNSRRFEIAYILNPYESNRYLELMCVERI